MELKQLFNDDDAVSPVIGVILMVAITVILAAVIATFVLGLGDSVDSNAPQASFECQGTSLYHASGDSLEYDRLTAKGSASLVGSSGDTYAAGDQVANSFGGSNAALTWTSSNGEDSATLRDTSC